MKKKLMINSIAVYCLLSSLAFSFEIDKQLEDTSYWIKDVCFVDSLTGWAVGIPHWDQNQKQYVGTIIKTTDGAKTWMEQNIPINETLYGISFIDQNSGWAVGSNGVILHTEDEGKQWNLQTVETTDDFSDVVFTDANHGFAICTRVIHFNWYDEADVWQSTIWSTSDGGENWLKQAITDSTSILKAIDFIDSDQGWIVGAKYIGDKHFEETDYKAMAYYTDNGGMTWEEKFDLTMEATLTAIDFIDSKHGFATSFAHTSLFEGGTIFSTSNGGTSWIQQEPDDDFRDIQFINPDSGYAVGLNYIGASGPPVYRTMNGGNTWERILMKDHSNEGLFCLMVWEGRVIALGDYDYCVCSQEPWKPVEDQSEGMDLFNQKYLNTHYIFNDIFFVNTLEGWTAGRQCAIPEHWGQVIFHTSNGGLTWEKQYEQDPPSNTLFSTFGLNKIQFLDNQRGWAVGKAEVFLDNGYRYDGSILHTIDGGNKWIQQGGNLERTEFYSVHFQNDQNGWALEEGHYSEIVKSGSIFLAHTVDGGENWNWVDTQITANSFSLIPGDLVFTDSLHGWIVGGHGTVVHTEDGGKSWTKLFLPSPYVRCRALDFNNQMNGWIAGDGLFHTEDGGLNWIQIPADYAVDFYDIQFLDSLHGWIAGENGIILGTDNGGSTWHEPESFYLTFTDLRGISFINDTTGWAVGKNGVILKVSGYPKSNINTIHSQKEFSPDQIVLQQNFPNPFNESTTIQFTLNKPLYVEVKIYDILGKEVESLYHGFTKAGQKKIVWKAGNMPSGIYVLLVKTESCRNIKKIVFKK